MNFRKLNTVLYDTDDGSGSGSPDGASNTGAAFSIEDVPDSLRQELIDKGVRIGMARAKKDFESKPDENLISFLKEKGLESPDDIDALIDIAVASEGLPEMLEELGAESFNDFMDIVAEESDEDLDDEDDHQSDSLRSAIESLRNSKAQEAERFQQRESGLVENIRKLITDQEFNKIASKYDLFDPDDLRQLKDNIIVEEEDGNFRMYVRDAEGNKRFDENGEPLPLETLAKEYLTNRPHLLKTPLMSGQGTNQISSGTQQAQSDPEKGIFSQEDLKDPSFVAKNIVAIRKAVEEDKLDLPT